MTDLSASARRNAWLCIALLTAGALAFCAAAIASPFWGENDTWSNLLPVVHLRQAVLIDHRLPLHSDLWYGGWDEWRNPLWSFLYLPSTLAWLALPLDWGMRLIFTGHLIFSLLAGRKLASLFVPREIERMAAAILLTSPMLPALIAGHVERALGWGWLLFALIFLLDESLSPSRRGLWSGLCWGVMALAGSNYHVFYAGLLLVPLVLSFKDGRLLRFFAAGASLGLLHLPSVWHLIGVSRVLPGQSIGDWTTDVFGLFQALAIGLGPPMWWEHWALIGIPVVYLFARSLVRSGLALASTYRLHVAPQRIALIASIIALGLLATGALYQGHHLLDSFRIAVRAVAVIAVAIMLFVLIELGRGHEAAEGAPRTAWPRLFLLTSALQVAVMAWVIRPEGTLRSPYSDEAARLVEVLNADGAQSVWFSLGDFSDSYLQLVLNLNGFALPNAYYGDMGQSVPVSGPHCGYSFDHLIDRLDDERSATVLVDDVRLRKAGELAPEQLQSVGEVSIYGRAYGVYRVRC